MTVEPSTCAFLLPELAAVGDTACRMLDFGEEDELLGEAILLKVKGLIDRKQVTSADVVRMALVADVLRVAEETILADDTVTEREVHYALPLVRDAARRLAAFRAYYEHWREVGPDGVRGFMKEHRGDKQLFGGMCSQTRWLGLEIVLRLANQTRDRGALDRYSELMLRLYEEIVSLEQDRTPSAEARQRIEERLGLRRKLEHADRNAPKPAEDPRIAAFCSPTAPPVFHAVELANQVWLKDPFDVESVQSAPRQMFARLLQRSGTRGSVMVVLGDAGSGKTHLMRALRNETHGQRAGYVGYLQLSGAPADWASYVLACVVDSLEKPYSAPEVPQSGLMCLSEALLLAAAPEQRARLKADELTDDQLGDLVFAVADQVLKQPKFSDLDLDVTRALVFLQLADTRYYTRVVKFLRGQALGRKDAELLGGLAPRADGAFGMLTALAKVIERVDGGAFVVLLDQLEDIFNQAGSKDLCVRVMDLVRRIVDTIPNSIVVITSLHNFYKELRSHLTKAVLDRLERDPAVMELKEQRSEDDTRTMIALRLQQLYEHAGVRFRDAEPCFPIPAELIDRQQNLRARDLITHLDRYQQACVASNRLLAYSEFAREKPADEPAGSEHDYAREWAEFLAAHTPAVPTDDETLLALLGWAVSAEPQGDSVRAGKLLLRMTNHTSRGGKLTRQLEQLRDDAKKDQRRPIAVRGSEFGGTPGTALAKVLGKFVQEGGRTWVVDQATWRQLLSFKEFSENHRDAPGFETWVRREQPWLQLDAVREALHLSRRPAPMAASVQPPAPVPPSPLIDPQPAPAQQTSGSITVGTVVSVRKQPAEIDLQTLKQHAAFLGASGSGKTSLALNVIEQAAERGIGVLMLDRKGDLGVYADPQCWQSSDPDAQRVRRLQALRSKLEVRMYTPGNPLGRSLRIRTVPPGLARLPPHERSQLASFSAQALLSMAGGRADPTQLAILGKAIEVSSQLSGIDPELRDVVGLIADQDESLLAEIGHLDPRHMKKLVDKLEALRINHEVLLEGKEPPLSAEALLGLDGSVQRGRVPVTIISTKFLGGPACVDFWVSQLLIELSRWCSRSPSANLQALLFLDEADAYLPAATKPATKEPLQGLLKRARSAGLGVMLATQSPGDLDYKARDNIATWWVGRIGSSTAIEKMKPLLSECRIDISSALATQSTGEFFQIAGGNAVRIRSDRSLMQTTQLDEDRIVELSRANAPAGQAVA